MKRFLTVMLTLILATSLCLPILGCGPSQEENGGDNPPAHVCEYDRTIIEYKEKDNKLYIGNPCSCGELDLIEEAVDVDQVITLAPDYTEVNDGDVVVFKSGIVGNVKIASNASNVRLVGENGAKFFGLSVENVKNLTIENLIVTGTYKMTLGNVENVTVKNCDFSEMAGLHGLKSKPVKNLSVLDCTFKNLNDSKLISAISIPDYDGLTIKNCEFDNVEYNALQVGNYSAKGDFLLKGCSFKDIGSRIIYLVSVKDLTSCVIAENFFYDHHDNYMVGDPEGIKKSTGVYIFTSSSEGTITIGVNSWANVPTFEKKYITLLATYNMEEQESMN